MQAIYVHRTSSFLPHGLGVALLQGTSYNNSERDVNLDFLVIK